MIFQTLERDTRYHPYFAWLPTVLDGPDEWDRSKILGVSRRVVWLQWIWRYRTKPSPHYALPHPLTRNKLLIDSIEGRPTAFETREKNPCPTSSKSAAP